MKWSGLLSDVRISLCVIVNVVGAGDPALDLDEEQRRRRRPVRDWMS